MEHCTAIGSRSILLDSLLSDDVIIAFPVLVRRSSVLETRGFDDDPHFVPSKI
jgi:hypothetical protein